MMTYLIPAVVALQSADEGLTASKVVQGLPRDPVSIFALLLILVGAGAVLWFGRPRGSGGGTRSAQDGPA